jgi:four helix bundle protein
MNKNYLKLNDFPAYKKAFHLSNYIWDIVITWYWFAKRTIGLQFVDAAASISANLAEGFGRYHKKDKIKFYIQARGSLKECFDWNEKSKIRKLLTSEQYKKIFSDLNEPPLEINKQIKFTREKLRE